MNNTRQAIELLLARQHSFDWDCLVEIVIVLAISIVADLLNKRGNIDEKKKKISENSGEKANPQPVGK